MKSTSEWIYDRSIHIDFSTFRVLLALSDNGSHVDPVRSVAHEQAQTWRPSTNGHNLFVQCTYTNGFSIWFVKCFLIMYSRNFYYSLVLTLSQRFQTKRESPLTGNNGHVARLPEDPAHRILSCRDPRGWTMPRVVQRLHRYVRRSPI